MIDNWKREAVRLLLLRRRELDWSQETAAKKAGVTQSLWSLIETGKREPRYDLLRAMCEAVGLVWRDACVKPRSKESNASNFGNSEGDSS